MRFALLVLVVMASCNRSGEPINSRPKTSVVESNEDSAEELPGRRAATEATSSVATGGGPSCEEAVDRYAREYDGGPEQADGGLSAKAYGAVLNRGTYLTDCSVLNTTTVKICAAIQNGIAVGVSVRLEPYEPTAADCVARAVRALAFPSAPQMDVAKTTFAATQ